MTLTPCNERGRNQYCIYIYIYIYSKATRPFPLWSCTIEERVWLRETSSKLVQSENHLSPVVDDEKIKMKLRRDAARHSSNISAGVELDLKRGISIINKTVYT